ncbi:uncharacterized protein LOC118196328 [Stegodyphus dumicola]|uniref:uncharacterized protein LOC118196328 n=1 Tax=Stegodyphus dumicola TaxID=202533 RepID=UPI0015B152F2|nr:uncharacterized protein LOC118196328 [Stegodyphus dumicola]
MKLIKFAVLAAALCVIVLGDSSDLEDDDNSTVIYEEGSADESPMVEIDKIFTHSFFVIPGNGTCEEGVPCGYATFATSITTREIFVKSNCDCPEGSICYLNALQSSSYVYRCSQSRNETDPILKEVAVPSEFPVQNNTRTLRSSSMFDNNK